MTTVPVSNFAAIFKHRNALRKLLCQRINPHYHPSFPNHYLQTPSMLHVLLKAFLNEPLR
jgi:hypothetical protein